MKFSLLFDNNYLKVIFKTRKELTTYVNNHVTIATSLHKLKNSQNNRDRKRSYQWRRQIYPTTRAS